MFSLLEEPFMESFFVGFNGVGGGATVEERLHFQVFRYPLPLYALRASQADYSLGNLNGVEVALLNGSKALPVSAVLFEGNDPVRVSGQVWRFLGFLEKESQPCNLHWTVDRMETGNVYKIFVVLRNPSGEISSVSKMGMGVSETGGLYTVPSPVFLLKRKLKNFCLTTPEMVLACAKLFEGLRRFEGDSLKKKGFEKALKNLLLRIEQVMESGKNPKEVFFWLVFKELDENQKETVMEYLRELFEIFKSHGILPREIASGLKLEAFEKIGLIDPELAELFREDLLGLFLTDPEKLLNAFFKHDPEIKKGLFLLKAA